MDDMTVTLHLTGAEAHLTKLALYAAIHISREEGHHDQAEMFTQIVNKLTTAETEAMSQMQDVDRALDELKQ